MISPPGVPSLQRNSMLCVRPPPVRRKILSVWTLSAVQSANYITPRPARPAGCTEVRQVKTGNGWRKFEENEGPVRERPLLQAGNRQDPGNVVPGLAIRRDAVELL